MGRYTATYSSNAFSHAQYEAPVKNTESAATRTLKTTGTSIEDYGRRGHTFDKSALVSALTAGKSTGGIFNQFREIVRVDDPNCAHCVNKHMIEDKKSSWEADKNSTLTFEQQRIAAAKAAEEAERARKRAEREANQHEMNLTLQQIQDRKRAEWEAKKNDTTNLEITNKLNKETQELTSKALQDRLASKETYRDELNRKRAEAIQLNIQGKITDRELERRLNGLTFE